MTDVLDELHADKLDLSWQSDAACVGHNPQLWFSTDRWDIRDAKAICADCPAKDPCLQFARDTAADGTWGGTTWHERNRGHSGDDRRGWRHLSGWERREIRRRRHTTTATNAEIARVFGVSPRTVSRICREQEGD